MRLHRNRDADSTEIDIDTETPPGWGARETVSTIAASNERALAAVDNAVDEHLRFESTPYLYCATPGGPVIEIRTHAQWERIRARECAWYATKRTARRSARVVN